MSVGEQTLARVLDAISNSPAPLSTADLAALLGFSSPHMWQAVTKLQEAPRRVRVADWRAERPGTREPLYDTRVDLPNAPRPPGMTARESYRKYMAGVKADPVRYAKHRERARDYEAKYKAKRRPRVMVAALAAEALRLLLDSHKTVGAGQVARRAGISRRSADTALGVMVVATPKAARVAGWTNPERGGSRAPLFDLQLDLPDVPRPPMITTEERNRIRREKRAANPTRINLKQQEWRAQQALDDKPRAPASPFAALNWKAPS